MPPPFPAIRKTVDNREFLCFFTKIFGFSNHYPCSFTIDGVQYCCSEQYYMFHKATHFGYHGAAREIMQTQDARTIKQLGTADTLRKRQADGLEPAAREFDHYEWREIKSEIMLEALRAKFNPNNTLLYNMLLKTENAYIVESSPSDSYWGIGHHMDSDQILDTAEWFGKNQMGRLLMRLRDELWQEWRAKPQNNRRSY